MSFYNEERKGQYTLHFFELKLFQFISSVSIHNNDYDKALIEGIIVNEELTYKDKYILLNFFDTDHTTQTKDLNKDLNTLFTAYSQKIITLLNNYSIDSDEISIEISFNRGEHENENGNEDSIEIILNKQNISFVFAFVEYQFEFNSDSEQIIRSPLLTVHSMNLNCQFYIQMFSIHLKFF